jgi:hypothetical protein
MKRERRLVAQHPALLAIPDLFVIQTLVVHRSLTSGQVSSSVFCFNTSLAYCFSLAFLFKSKFAVIVTSKFLPSLFVEFLNEVLRSFSSHTEAKDTFAASQSSNHLLILGIRLVRLPFRYSIRSSRSRSTSLILRASGRASITRQSYQTSTKYGNHCWGMMGSLLSHRRPMSRRRPQ